MLGKGLESLIPKKQNIQSPRQKAANADVFGATIPAENTFVSTGKNQSISSDEFDISIPAISPSSILGQNKSDSSLNDEISSETILDFETRKLANKKDFQEYQKIKPQAKDAIFYIETDKIKPNPHQPRKDFNEESLRELANSIREHGILQPLIISKIEKETEFGARVEYQLIAGERRLRAAQLIGLESVPAIIKNVARDAERLEMAIIENLQRSALNPVETARAYAKLQDVFGLTQREIANRLSKSRETIANTLRLLNLPGEIQEAVSKNQINESQARLLLIIEDSIQQQNLFEELINNNLTVRELRSLIKKDGKKAIINNQSITDSQIVDPEIHYLQEQLTELLSAKVKIVFPQNQKEKGGKIIIDFYSPEEIQGIIKKLSL